MLALSALPRESERPWFALQASEGPVVLLPSVCHQSVSWFMQGSVVCDWGFSLALVRVSPPI